jgi:TonB family protein
MISASDRSTYHVGDTAFAYTLLVAALLHLMVFAVWGLLPVEPIISIPVRVLNIKLGGGDEPLLRDEDMVAEAVVNDDRVEAALNKQFQPLVREQDKPALKSLDKSIGQENVKNGDDDRTLAAFDRQLASGQGGKRISVSEQMARQFVRERGETVPKGAGSALGEITGTQAEILARYEQLISSWIQKFKVYPADARSHGLEGEAVVRIRIDRNGNIRYFMMEKDTGHAVLDRAVIAMLKKANPVPPVPKSYPAGALLEFLVPVSFKLQ